MSARERGRESEEKRRGGRERERREIDEFLIFQVTNALKTDNLINTFWHKLNHTCLAQAKSAFLWLGAEVISFGRLDYF